MASGNEKPAQVLPASALVAGIISRRPLHPLLRAGVNLAARDAEGLCALHWACAADNPEAAEALLDYAARHTRPLRLHDGSPSRAPGSPWALVTAPATRFATTPLHLAAEKSDALLRLILLHRSVCNVQASFMGITISARPNHELLELRDARGWTLLHSAVRRPNPAALKQLLTFMSASGHFDPDGSRHGSSGSGVQPGSGYREPAAAGAAGGGAGGGVLNAYDHSGHTPLQAAASLGHAECCRLLLRAGADIAMPSAPPESAQALHLAACANHTAAVEALVRHAIQTLGFRAAQELLLRPNSSGYTALHVAVLHGCVEAAQRLLHLVFPVDTRAGPLGRTALHLAAMKGHVPMLGMLLRHMTPGQRELPDAEGFTAMHLAAAAGCAASMRSLAAGQCSVNARAVHTPAAPEGCEGWTPLHCAVRRGDLAAVELLVAELHADPNARDARGRTPADLAVVVAAGSREGSGCALDEGDEAALCHEDGMAATIPSGEGGDAATRTAEATGGITGGSGTGGVMPGAYLDGPNTSGDGAVPELSEGAALAVLRALIALQHEEALRRRPHPQSGQRGGRGGRGNGSAGSESGQHTTRGWASPAPSTAAIPAGGGGGGGGRTVTEAGIAASRVAAWRVAAGSSPPALASSPPAPSAAVIAAAAALPSSLRFVSEVGPTGRGRAGVGSDGDPGSAPLTATTASPIALGGLEAAAADSGPEPMGVAAAAAAVVAAAAGDQAAAAAAPTQPPAPRMRAPTGTRPSPFAAASLRPRAADAPPSPGALSTSTDTGTSARVPSSTSTQQSAVAASGTAAAAAAAAAFSAAPPGGLGAAREAAHAGPSSAHPPVAKPPRPSAGGAAPLTDNGAAPSLALAFAARLLAEPAPPAPPPRAAPANRSTPPRPSPFRAPSSKQASSVSTRRSPFQQPSSATTTSSGTDAAGLSTDPSPVPGVSLVPGSSPPGDTHMLHDRAAAAAALVGAVRDGLSAVAEVAEPSPTASSTGAPAAAPGAPEAPPAPAVLSERVIEQALLAGALAGEAPVSPEPLPQLAPPGSPPGDAEPTLRTELQPAPESHVPTEAAPSLQGGSLGAGSSSAAAAAGAATPANGSLGAAGSTPRRRAGRRAAAATWAAAAAKSALASAGASAAGAAPPGGTPQAPQALAPDFTPPVGWSAAAFGSPLYALLGEAPPPDPPTSPLRRRPSSNGQPAVPPAVAGPKEGLNAAQVAQVAQEAPQSSGQPQQQPQQEAQVPQQQQAQQQEAPARQQEQQQMAQAQASYQLHEPPSGEPPAPAPPPAPPPVAAQQAAAQAEAPRQPPGASPASRPAPLSALAAALAPASSSGAAAALPTAPSASQPLQQQLLPQQPSMGPAPASGAHGSNHIATLALSAAPSEADAPTVVVPTINGPVGYTALNRAILLRRRGLSDALLSLLPRRGAAGVFVLGASPSSTWTPRGRRNTGDAGALSSSASSDRWPSQSSGAAGGPSRTHSLVPCSSNNGRSQVLVAASTSLQLQPHPHQNHGHQHHAHANGNVQRSRAAPGQQQNPLQLPSAPPSPFTSHGFGHHTPPLVAYTTQPAHGAQSPMSTGPFAFHNGLAWDDMTGVYRTRAPPPSHGPPSPMWLYWPGRLDPSTGWLLVEMDVVEAGAAGGHVWFGLGPTQETLLRTIDTCGPSDSSTSQLHVRVHAHAHTHAHAHGTSLAGSAHPAAASAAATSTPSPAGSFRRVTSALPTQPPTPTATAPAAAAPLLGGARCPVLYNGGTHVVCIRDGQVFRGGNVIAMDGNPRLDVRPGDIVGLFWNRRGRTGTLTLNGRFSSRMVGLPGEDEAVPVVGLLGAGFAFRWRCGSALRNSGGGTVGDTASARRRSAAAAVDSLMVREQMLHDDPETPWQCKEPSITSIHFAAWAGNVRVMPSLVRGKGFLPDEPDADGWSPLHYAAVAGHAEAVRVLLQLGAHSDLRTKYGTTPTMLAVKYGRSAEHAACVRQLVAAGAALSVRDGRGRTLLMLAAKAGSIVMVQLLLEAGLDPSATDCDDREAQQYAGDHGPIFRLLRNAQAAQRAAARKAAARAAQQAAREAALREAAEAHAAAQALGASPTALGGIAAALLRGEPASPPGGTAAGGPPSDAAADDEDADASGVGSDSDSDEGGVVGGGRRRGRRADAAHMASLAGRWQVDADQLIRGRLIEQGAFGAVYEGSWCGVRVAIKQVRLASSAGALAGAGGEVDDAHALSREVAILRALPPHERIARLLGALELPGEGTCLVMAYYPYTLQGVMQSERLRRSWLTPARRAAICRQVAEGLAFLHGLPGGARLIHRDLKPNNILLEAAPSLDVKICDFGLSRILADRSVASSSGAGHAFWMAPELLRALPYDEKVDVYSYGVIMYQLAYWVDDELYRGLNKAQVDYQVVHGMLRLQDRLPGGIDPGVAALVRDCLADDPAARPSMDQVLERLAGVRELPQPQPQGGAGAGGAAGGGAAAAAGGGTGGGGGGPAAGAGGAGPPRPSVAGAGGGAEAAGGEARGGAAAEGVPPRVPGAAATRPADVGGAAA